MAGKKRQIVFEGKNKEYFDLLMRARESLIGQMKYRTNDALSCGESGRSGTQTHMADISDDAARHEMELRLLGEDSNVLQLIDEALQRLAEGKYGICQDCGKFIGEGRLQVKPYAVYCVKCKEKRESGGR